MNVIVKRHDPVPVTPAIHKVILELSPEEAAQLREIAGWPDAVTSLVAGKNYHSDTYNNQRAYAVLRDIWSQTSDIAVELYNHA